MEELRFKYTTSIKKIRALTKRKKVIQGSTSAGKTYGIIPVLIDRAIKEPRIKITIIAETIPAVKDGCVDIFKAVMQDTNRWIDDNWIGSPMEYTFTNGSRIQFKSFDSFGKAKASGKRDILFINEGNHISYKIADTLMTRSKETYIDFNADEEFWAHKEVLKEPNSEFLALTYLDNEALPPELLEDLLMKRDKAFYNTDLEREDLYLESNIKSQYWANWWLIYGLGEIGSYSNKRIYNFEVVKEIPPHAKKLPRGMDFGFSPDPTCMVDVYLDGIDLYLDEIFSQNNLLPEEVPGAIDRPCIADRLDTEAIRHARVELPDIVFDKDEEFYLEYSPYKNKEAISANDKKIIDCIAQYRQWLIIADSAGAKEIRDLKRRRYNVRGVKKKKGSIGIGIARLQSYDIKITQRSVNIKSGMEKWLRKEDENGKLTAEPIGHEPDTLAASRYVMLGKALW